MRKKVDLNAPRNTQNDFKKSRNNHSFSGVNKNSNNANMDDPNVLESDDNNRGEKAKQKFKELTLRAFGAPKEAAKVASKSDIDGSLPGMNGTKKIKANLKFPIAVKMVLFGLIAFLPLIGLMMFVVLFSNASATGISDYVALAESCSKITVTNTGCDSNGNNCTHIYDGEVDFEDYIAGVVAGLSDGANNKEFYKAISVMVRTYFLANASDSCNVYGNSSFMEYVDINDASDKGIIMDAVDETKRAVLVNSDNDLVSVDYSMACVVNSDGNSYYLRYGTDSDKYQQIAVSFDNESQIYRGKLNTLYSSVDKTNTNYENRACPSGNDSNGLSLIGALYLAKNKGYNYSNILEHYYGEVSEAKAEGTFVGNQVDGFINPVEHLTCCTSPFSCRFHPIDHVFKSHRGIDLSGYGASEGDSVYATKDGEVISLRTNCPGKEDGTYGNYIQLRHDDGTMTLYAHLLYGGVFVSMGERVVQGQKIALVGNTGGSTGAHLHYEVYVDGKNVDPYNYLDTSNVYWNNSICNKCYATADNSYDMSYCGG